MRTASWGGRAPPSRRGLEGKLYKNLAMEISDWKEIWNGAVQLERDLQWRFPIGKRLAMEIFKGDLQWRFAMEIFIRDFQWRLAMV